MEAVQRVQFPVPAKVATGYVLSSGGHLACVVLRVSINSTIQRISEGFTKVCSCISFKLYYQALPSTVITHMQSSK